MYAFFSSIDQLSSLRTSEPFMAESTPPIKTPQLHFGLFEDETEPCVA